MLIFRLITIIFLSVSCSHIVYADEAAEPAMTVLLDEIKNTSDDQLRLTEMILRISDVAQRDIMGASLDSDPVEAALDKMAREIKSRTLSAAQPEELVAVINEYLYGVLGFSFDYSNLFTAKPESSLIQAAIEKRKGTCLSLSLIYLILAEKLKLDIEAVYVPEHIYVRFRDGEKQINIETTKRGQSLGNDYYLNRFLSPEKTSADLKALTKKQIIAVYLNNIATQYKLRGKLERAVEIFKYSLTFFPDSPTIYTNLGNAYERMGDIRKAIFQYKIALSQNPYLCHAHYNLGLAHYLYTKRNDLAMKHGEIALKLGCPMHPKYRGFVMDNLTRKQ